MADDPNAQTPPDGGQDQSLGKRVDGLETEQKRQGGVLDRIEGLLTDRDKDSGTVVNADPPPAGVNPAEMAEQMKQAVRDVQAEDDAALGRQVRHRPPPEQTPREVMVKGKARLQRALFGGDA